MAPAATERHICVHTTSAPGTSTRARSTAPGAGHVATFVTLSGELAVYGQPLLAASGQILVAAYKKRRPLTLAQQ